MDRKPPVTLADILREYGGPSRSTRVVRYAEDGVTPRVIEHTRVDEEGTTWITQHDLGTGETRPRHVPADR